jgi:hypothetical protein
VSSAGSADAYHYIGQRFSSPNFSVYEDLFDFDTSTVGVASTVTVVTLSIYGNEDASQDDFTAQARVYDWGGTVTTADWVSGNPDDTPSLDDYTLVATRSTVGGWPTNGYATFTSDLAFLTNVDQTGTTYVIVHSDRQLAGNQPTQREEVGIYFANDATGVGGTDRDPKLYVEWTEGGAAALTGIRIERHIG